MDIKPWRRETIRVPDDYPGPYGQGNQAADQNRYWWVRAQSWSEGADVNSYRDVELENEDQLRKAQVPYTDHEAGPQRQEVTNNTPPHEWQHYKETPEQPVRKWR